MNEWGQHPEHRPERPSTNQPPWKRWVRCSRGLCRSSPSVLVRTPHTSSSTPSKKLIGGTSVSFYQSYRRWNPVSALFPASTEKEGDGHRERRAAGRKGHQLAWRALRRNIPHSLTFLVIRTLLMRGAFGKNAAESSKRQTKEPPVATVGTPQWEYTKQIFREEENIWKEGTRTYNQIPGEDGGQRDKAVTGRTEENGRDLGGMPRPQVDQCSHWAVCILDAQEIFDWMSSCHPPCTGAYSELPGSCHFPCPTPRGLHCIPHWLRTWSLNLKYLGSCPKSIT